MAAASRPDKTVTPDIKKQRRRRWLAVAAIVVILHALVLLGLVHMPLWPGLPDTRLPPTIDAILLPPPAPPTPPAPPRQPRPRATPQTQPGTPTPEEPTSQASAPDLATSSGGATTATTGPGGEGAAAAPGASAGAPAAEPGPPAPQYTAPPSATMHYASYVNGVQNPDGLIRWEQDGKRYHLAVETRVLWFRFVFQSSGEMGERGLVPGRYEEARRSKVEVARFDPAAGVVAFETRGNQVPMPANFQDRFSVFLQLVGWVRADPQRYATPGVTETFNVADTRDVEAMQVQYVGEDTIDTGSGMVRAKHFVRLPRHPGDKRRVEIWLAQSLGWMPARLRQTEPDGTQIDLVYRSSEGR